MRTLITGTLNWIAKYAAASYIAGPEVADAIRVCKQLAEHGRSSTICPWDGPHDSREHVFTTYEAALTSIIDENIDSYLSIKVPSIGYNFELLTELIDIARGHGVRIHFDSLAPETASPSLLLLERASKKYHKLSCTLPSRWGRSIADAKKIIDLGVAVRVVKGQWTDPVETNRDAGSNFLKLIDILAGRASQVAVATHDTELAKESITRLQASGTVCELEQLYGLPMRVDSVAKPLGVPVRVYVPYGYAYLSYAISAMRKRPIILAWLLRDFLLGIKKNPLKAKAHNLKNARSISCIPATKSKKRMK
jgi:proline dehydrogenase